ncbi:PAS domain S-box-containing protein/diguanylate cyclase (GGDEF) domain-containing protein [Nocardioides terrae]|uniref:PAS domain S-box-containing protein/diguanylate cyclase (GGDEF) domain-containing protein n=1 Tax=Nocardioides terrae TaxID=574651 RepID=A0A1I1ND65_9ACTN|nr:GGDEF domain-containing phosphodiesterase [Nocardioides terrae]SFC95415.1 PAS domain S-box-containing protein/diguanylate cyclase (GGDEF) domain-containing protein [Nocardioides terrae]
MSESELFDPLIRATGEAVWNWSLDDRIEWHDSPYSSTLGITGLLGTSTTAAWAERLHPDDAERVIASLRGASEHPERLWSEEYRLRRDDGGYATVLGRGSVLCDSDGMPVRMMGTLRDVTAEHDARRQLREAADYTSALFESLPGALYHVDADLRLVRWNAALTEVTGYTDEELAGMSATDLFPPDDRPRVSAAIEEVFASGSGQVWADFQRKDGPGLPYLFTGRRFTHGGEPGYVGIALPMAEQVALQQRLQYEATHDSLTGLANRSLLHDELTRAIEAAERDGHLIALLDIDLDRFKIVNDGFGHPFGDGVLQVVARRLRTLVCLDDTVARMGGDEFVVLAPRVDRTEDIEEMAQRLVDSFTEPFLVEGRRIHLTGSIGVSFYPRDGANGAELIDHADMAMYYAKAAGRSAFRAFAPEMAAKAQRRTEMEIDLRRAADEGQLWLAFQPKIDLGRRTITGCEALLRWDHPVHGSISPADFIPIAEDSGLILPIGEWVLETACRQGRAWLDAGLPPVSIAVNISAAQLFQRDPVGWVTGVLESTGFPPELLELELTESQLAQDVETVVAVFGRLRDVGIKLAIDDFGTGYSSLDYLRRFDATSLKIDRSFVDGMLREPGDAAIVRAAIALAHSFGLSVTAEGVEAEAQQDFLRRLGCDEAQGFLLGRPVPAAEFAALFQHT